MQFFIHGLKTNKQKTLLHYVDIVALLNNAIINLFTNVFEAYIVGFYFFILWMENLNLFLKASYCFINTFYSNVKLCCIPP